MNKYRLALLRRLYRRPEPGDDGAGAAPAAAPAAEAAPAPAPAPDAAPAPPAPAPADAPAAPAAPAVDDGAPKSMLEAIQAASKPKPDPAAPAIVGLDGKPLVADPAKKPDEVDPKAGDKPDDLTAMPDGLAPKAQQRFQKLVETNKEVTQKVERLEQTTEYFTTTLRENRISQPQFELATRTVGLINKGDYDGAMSILQEQMQQLAVLAGKPAPGIDALAGHVDLRERVANMELTEQDALQLARARVQSTHAQQAQQRQVETQRTQATEQQRLQTEQQAFAAGQQALDEHCARLQKTDLDYARIEALILPKAVELFGHMQPKDWPAAFQRQYDLIKSVGAPVRGNPVTGNLRTGGADNPQAQPKNMREAIFGGS